MGNTAKSKSHDHNDEEIAAVLLLLSAAKCGIKLYNLSRNTQQKIDECEHSANYSLG
jgi:hypothetical protein